MQDRTTDFTFFWNGQEIPACEGETVLGALIANGVSTLRITRFQEEPRNMLCGMGICYECLVTIDGKPNRRACLTPVRAQMVVTSGAKADARGSETLS